MTDFQQDKEITPVIFRMTHKRKGGEVMAIFPTDAASYDPGLQRRGSIWAAQWKATPKLGVQS